MATSGGGRGGAAPLRSVGLELEEEGVARVGAVAALGRDRGAAVPVVLVQQLRLAQGEPVVK